MGGVKEGVVYLEHMVTVNVWQQMLQLNGENDEEVTGASWGGATAD